MSNTPYKPQTIEYQQVVIRHFWDGSYMMIDGIIETQRELPTT